MKPQNTQDLNVLADRINTMNRKWWHDSNGVRLNRNRGELLMLVVTELAEACEGERKDLMDDHLPNRKMAEVEMADTYIRLLDFASGFGIELDWLERSGTLPKNKAEALLSITGSVWGIHWSNEDCKDVSETLALIREYCITHNYDLFGALEEKMAYNQTRKDHTHEARQLANGKKF